MRIALLVSDDVLNRKLMRDILEIRFHVLVAASASDARAVLQNHVPDIVVLDVQTSGMDGLLFLRELKRLPQTMVAPVVIVSGHVRREDVACGMANGCDMYVAKPIIDDPFRLVERIHALLRPASGQPLLVH
jgi:two-component system phosphate regulon response regulator PhoB